MTRSSLSLLLVTLILPAASMAGSVLELVTREYSQDPPVVGTVEISTQGNKSRLEITSVTSNESGGMIFKSDRKEMIAIDHEAKEYYVFDQTSIDRIAAQVSAAMQQFEDALEQMAPEERALAEQMMPGRIGAEDAAPTEAELEATGVHDTIAGYRCAYYDVVRDERRIREICVTGWDDIEEGQEVAAAMMELGDFFESMRKAFAGTGGLDVMDRQQEMFAYMKKLGGYPVLARDFAEDGQLESESLLQSARRMDVAAELFEPPAGYREAPMQ
ncbi:MAG: hypothetical protein ACREQZ_07700 [Woeseiaceae bacterium]